MALPLAPLRSLLPAGRHSLREREQGLARVLTFSCASEAQQSFGQAGTVEGMLPADLLAKDFEKA